MLKKRGTDVTLRMHVYLFVIKQLVRCNSLSYKLSTGMCLFISSRRNVHYNEMNQYETFFTSYE